MFPEADSAIAELMVVGYQKFLESDSLGLTNWTQETQNLKYGYGNTGLELYAHSCGGMTVHNALNSLKQQGVQNIEDKTNVNLYAPVS